VGRGKLVTSFSTGGTGIEKKRAEKGGDWLFLLARHGQRWRVVTNQTQTGRSSESQENNTGKVGKEEISSDEGSRLLGGISGLARGENPQVQSKKQTCPPIGEKK